MPAGDSEERLRVVAELAYRMKTEGNKGSRRAPMIRAWNAAVALLPLAWTRDQRDRFLRWLVASAGVLVDRADRSVHFANLSFQEHLAAYHLFITVEGGERVAAVRAHMEDLSWWETLRLWAGLTSDHGPDKLSPALAMLRADPDGYWLAGMIFADGTGHGADFEVWAADLANRLSDPYRSGEDCARAWRACKQPERRAVLVTRLAFAREGLDWLAGTWHAHWCALAGFEVTPAPSLVALEAPLDSACATARSRVLVGGAASWPDGGELAVLRLWPAARSEAGIHLQAAIDLGAHRLEVQAMLQALQARNTRPWSEDDQALAEDFGRDSVRYFVRDFAKDSVRNFVRYFAQDFVPYFVRYFGRYFFRNSGRDSTRAFSRAFVQDFVEYFSRGFGQVVSRDFARDFVRDFVLFFVRYFDRDFVRDFGQYFVRDFVRDNERSLGLSTSMSYAPWLSRFAFLEDLARHPEHRDPPLSWGLQYYVRGDLMLVDDSVVMLDELCAQLGVAPLPLLEPMPDEVDLQLDDLSS